MLEKPDIQDATIITCLRHAYGLNIAQLAFLALGADRNTAVYRAVTDDATPYFIKLRSGVFDEMTILAPKFLYDQGIRQVIAPLATRSQKYWASLGDFMLTVSPFVAGHSGFEVDLSDSHWIEFGRALKGIHTAVMPETITARIPHESYSAEWRTRVKQFQALVEDTTFGDPIAAELAAFLRSKQAEISDLVTRAEALAAMLRTRSLEFILCHADIHAGNLLIDAHDTLYIVDWDTLTLAPKERDLMFVGGGLGGGGHTPQEEETLFYRGYGPTPLDPIALAYYRYERIVQDVAAYCEEILLTQPGSDDRAEGLRQLTSQFLPDQVVEIAYRSDKSGQ